MIAKQTIVDQIEITRSGHIQIRFGLLIVEGGVELSHEWHRTAIEPGGDVDAQMAAVNANLVSLGKAQCPATEVIRVKAIVGVVHTPAVVEAYREMQA